MTRSVSRVTGVLKSSFQNRNLAFLWLGQTISMAGDSIYEKALLWTMLDLTGSSGMTGLVALSGYLPTLIVGAWAGVLVDRFNRRRVMLIADVARTGLVLIVPALFVLDYLTPLNLFLITFAVALGAAFFNPARDALVPHLVQNESQLLKANALIQSSWMFALFLGPAVAVFLLEWLGVGAIQLFSIDSVTFIASFCCIFAIRTPRASETEDNAHGHIWHDFLEGLRLAVRDTRVRWLLIITAVDNLFIMGPATVGVVLFVRSVLQRDIASLMLVEACYSVGMVAGTLLLNIWGRYWNKGRLLLIGMIADGLTFVPLMWVDTLWGTAITIIIHSMAIPLLVVIRPALVQKIVPGNMQGRVFSLIGVTVVGLTAVSSGLTGIVAEVVSMPVVFAVIGVGAAVCGLYGWRVRELRES